MYFEKNGNDIDAFLDDDRDVTIGEVVEAMAYPIDIDFICLLNEGYLGNSYAQYEFVAIGSDGFKHDYGFGPNELNELNEKGRVTFVALDNEEE